MKFSLTEDHMLRGRMKSCAACPVALVIQEALGDKNFLIDGETVVHYGYDLWMLLPEKVNKWVHWYDMFYAEDRLPKNLNNPDYPKAVHPIEFELPLEEFKGKPYTHVFDNLNGVLGRVEDLDELVASMCSV